MFSCLLAGLLSLTAADSAAVDEAAKKALAELPGHSGFVFTELEASGPRKLFGQNDQQRFAIGSSFKLFILGTLVDEVNAQRRRIDDTMLLQRQLAGPPHSELAEWPVGAPVTLYTLALKMISISDNTATDHLLYLLGRETIERQMGLMGDEHAQWNRPLLSTREMTLLRNKKTGLLGRQYQQLDEAGKRVKPAHVVVRHNGVVIHDRDMKGPSPGGNNEDNTPGDFMLQNHGDPVHFRNIWVVEKR